MTFRLVNQEELPTLLAALQEKVLFIIVTCTSLTSKTLSISKKYVPSPRRGLYVTLALNNIIRM